MTETYPYLAVIFREGSQYTGFDVEYSDYLPYWDGMVGLPGAHYYTLVLNTEAWKLFDFLIKSRTTKDGKYRPLFYSNETIHDIVKMQLVVEEQSNACRLRYSPKQTESLVEFRPFWIRDYIDETQFRMPMEEVITNKEEWDWDSDRKKIKFIQKLTILT